MHMAAKNASTKTLEMLLKQGESMGYSRAQMLSFCDRENNSPLHSAVNSGDIAVHLRSFSHTSCALAVGRSVFEPRRAHRRAPERSGDGVPSGGFAGHAPHRQGDARLAQGRLSRRLYRDSALARRSANDAAPSCRHVRPSRSGSLSDRRGQHMFFAKLLCA
jgi:hypothetical protein